MVDEMNRVHPSPALAYSLSTSVLCRLSAFRLLPFAW